MEKDRNELRDLARRMMTEKWDYKSQTKKYVVQVMKMYKQEELMQLLEDLNYKELKMIAGCGVPGDAWRVCYDLLRKKKSELDLFIEQGGQQAHASVEHEGPEEEIPNGA